MEELNKDEIRKIAYNCRQATFLIEKKQIAQLTVREKLELKIHLTGCSVCRIFQQQSILLNQMIKGLSGSPQNQKMKLGEPFKKKMQERIEERLNKN